LLLTKRNKKEDDGENVEEGKEREGKRRNDALSGEAGGQRCWRIV